MYLAAAGVEQDANGEGEIFFLGEVLGLLEGLVLVDAAVILMKASDEAVFVANGEVDVDEVDVDLEGLDVVLIERLGRSVAGGWRTTGGGSLLRVEDGGETKAQGSGEQKRAHSPLDDKVGTEFAEN